MFGSLMMKFGLPQTWVSHSQMITDKKYIMEIDFELIPVGARLGETDPLGTDGKGYPVTGTALVHGKCYHLTARCIDDAMALVGGQDTATQDVVVADELGDKLPLGFFVEDFGCGDLLHLTPVKDGHPGSTSPWPPAGHE